MSKNALESVTSETCSSLLSKLLELLPLSKKKKNTYSQVINFTPNLRSMSIFRIILSENFHNLLSSYADFEFGILQAYSCVP